MAPNPRMRNLKTSNEKKNLVRQLALDCLSQLQPDHTTIVPVINQTIQRNHLTPADRGLLNELVYGTIRWRKHLDWVLRHFVAEGFQLDQRVRDILRLGTYQLLHLNKIPPHAAIYETVELAKPKRKTARFINAVLRSVQREADSLQYPSLESHPAQHISISQSYPLWLVEHWIAQHGLEWTLAFCQASNQVAPLSIRVNTLRTNRANLIESLTADGASVEEGRMSPDGLFLTDSSSLHSLKAYRDGWFYVQDESAMLVAHLLQPQPGEKVVDLCAAPGGKTTHIAQLMGNSGEILAVDLAKRKIQRITENCQRLGITNVHTQILTDDKDNLPTRFTDADRVLVDVPCSGFGTLRRHPDVRWKKSPAQIDQLVTLQLQLLTNAARYVKSGGVLVYSTCSTDFEENEQVIHRFLETHSHFIIEHAGGFLPIVPATAITSEGFLQTFPHEHGVDGAFAARLKAKEQ